MVILYVLLASVLLVPTGTGTQCGRMERFLLLQQWYEVYAGWVENGELYDVMRAQYRIFNSFTKGVPTSEKEVRRITPGDKLIAMEIFPDYSQSMTTLLTLDNDELFQANAEYRRRSRPSTSPELRDIIVQGAAVNLKTVVKASLPACHNHTVWDLCAYRIMDAFIP